MLIDTHCHLSKKDYDNLEIVIKSMGNNIMIASGFDNESNKEVIELIGKYKNIYGTIGIHPSEASTYKEEDLKYIEENICNSKIVGVGEIGLDYYWEKENKEAQKQLFIKQIELANKYKKVIVIHSRDAINDTYDILKDNLRGNKSILHCFGSSLEMAKKFIKLGTMIGVGGVVTFKNSQILKEVVGGIDISKLLLETDSPYLTPEPNRGKKNEPTNVKYVAKKIAEIKCISVGEVSLITTKNAVAQFDLNIDL